MLDLIFFTSNNIKLSHAMYMAEGYPVRVEGFRQKTYHASYDEPRIKSRKKLLESSYESALRQAKKASVDTSRHFFFLEDTSVKIESLSGPRKEVPGVDVKYWMKDQTFNSLDSLLKSKGNNRKATVRSDILLHVPDYYKMKWGIKDRYIIFTGVQEGRVAEKEYEVITNPVFPWLDNKTFNKWFVPEGEDIPISLLPIREADKYDFRRHAFLKMMNFFQDRMFGEEYQQTSLAVDVGPALIVCGFTCAGKTTVSQHLIKKYGYRHIEASDFMYLSYYLRHGVNSRIKIGDFAEKALAEKPHIAAEKIAEYLVKMPGTPAVISGFRSKKEIDWLVRRFENVRKFLTIFIHASEGARFERYNNRKRDGKELTLGEFRERDRQQVRMGVMEIEDISAKVLDNEGGLDDLFEKFDREVMRGQPFLRAGGIDFSRVRDYSGFLKLEDAILIALLSKWSNSENRDYFTTTAISRLIREVFPKLKPKHKDNVSRYFNQDFYSFYEIDSGSDESKRKYRLSNTGYGRAVEVYDKLVDNC